MPKVIVMKAKEAVKQFDGVSPITRYDLCKLYMNELAPRINLRVHGRTLISPDTFVGVVEEMDVWIAKVCRLLDISPEDTESIKKENHDMAMTSMEKSIEHKRMSF
ncbi:hypothetical protein ES707_01011 [subsurface metagenome]